MLTEVEEDADEDDNDEAATEVSRWKVYICGGVLVEEDVGGE